VNAAFSAVLGYPPSDLVEKVFFDFLHFDDREKARAVLSAAAEGLAGDLPPVNRFIRAASTPPSSANIGQTLKELARTTEPRSGETLRVPASLEGLAGPVRASGEPWELVARFRRKSGEYCWIEWHGQAHAGSWVVTGRDTSRRNLLEQAPGDLDASLPLQEERNQFEAYLESASEGVVSIDAQGRMLLVNCRMEAMFGYGRGELLGQPVDLLLPGRFAEAHARYRAGFFGAPHRRPMGQGVSFPGRRKNGSEFPVEVGLNWIRREGQIVALAVVTDAALRDAQEAERQQVLDTLRDLGRRLEEAREMERKRIAQEIHDGLGQELVALKMRLALLGSVLGAESHAAAWQVSQMTALVESLLRTIQRITTSLRPDVLDRLGLAPAVEWLVAEFERNEGIACTRSIQEVTVDTQSATTVFRVVQEFLTNVLRHAGATHIWLTLADTDGNIELEIRDDGNGIHPADLHTPAGTGLAGARERVQSTGGKMEIFGQPGEGTIIRLSLPREGSRNS